VGLVVVMLLAATLACNLTSEDEDTDSGEAPTVEATVTPLASFTPATIGAQTPTVVPTWTPRPPIVWSSPTPIAWVPTATPYPTLPPISTVLPYDIRITSPQNGSQVAGVVSITGSASHPNFLQYALEWAPVDNPGLWYPLTNPPQTEFVLNRVLGFWNTNTVADGQYYLRLHVWLTDGSSIYYPSMQGMSVQVSNTATTPPTTTPTPRPNKPPTIAAIANQEVETGQTITIPVQTSDPDGDAVELFVASSHPSIAEAEVRGSNQVALTGVSAGLARIVVTANDNYGGLSRTLFLVTVRGTNSAPSVSPLGTQNIRVNQVVDITVDATDPDGDPLTVEAEVKSMVPAIPGNTVVQAFAPNPDQNIVRLIGVSIGTATVGVEVSDGRGGISNTVFTVIVGQPNRSPVIDTIGDQSMTIGQSLDVSYVVTDPDGDSLTAYASSSNTDVVSAFVASTGTIRLSANNPGTATVSLSVNDGHGGFASASFKVTVGQPNRSPSVSAIDNQSLNVGQSLDIAVTADDPDGDELVAVATSDNAGVVDAFFVVFSEGLGTLRLSGTGAGTATVTVSVDDQRGGTDSTTFTVTVTQPNRPPVIDPIADQTLSNGDTRQMPFSAYDPDGDALTQSAESSNAAVVEASVTNSGVVTLTANQVGNATVTVQVDDSQALPVTRQFAVTVVAVNDPPVLDPINPVSMELGDTINVFYTASDPEGAPLNPQVASDDTGIVTAAVVAEGVLELVSQGVGSTTVTLTINDGVNAPVSRTFEVTVLEANDPPTITPIDPVTMDDGTTTDVSFTVTDPEGDPLSPVVESDDEAVVTASVTAPDTITLTANAPGNVTITLTVDDGANPPVSVTFAVLVQEVNDPPTIDPIPDVTMQNVNTETVSFVVNDPEGATLSVVANSDDEAVVTANVTAPGTITLTANGAGTATVTVTVNDGVNDPVSTTFEVLVEINAPPTVEAIPAVTMENGQTRDVIFNANDPEGEPLNPQASSSNEGVVIASVAGPNTIALEAVGVGDATVTLTVNDGTNPPVSVDFLVTVTPVNEPPTVDPIAPVTVESGTTTEVTFNAVDPEGAPLNIFAASNDEGIVGATVTGPDTITLTANSEGTTAVELSVDDGVNPAVTTSFDVTVEPPVNAPPAIDPIASVTMQAGTTQDVTFTASDPDGDPLTAVAGSDAPGVVTANVTGPNTIALTSAGAGAATVTLTVTDSINPPVSVQFGVTVEAPNQPPVVDPIAPVNMPAGVTQNVTFTASDPDGDPLTAVAGSDAPGVVTANVTGPNTIALTSAGAGAATVTLTVTDSINPPVSVQFGVTVEAPNQPPVVDPILSVDMSVGEVREVTFNAVDPEGAPLNPIATSDNPAVVTANVTAPNIITLTANQAGQATVTLTVNDGVNPPVSTEFIVTVTAVNNPPVIDPIPPQTLAVGEELTVPVNVTDPDGDPIVLTAISGDQNVVLAQAVNNNSVLLQGANPGTTSVSVTADDSREGGQVTIQFEVTVTPGTPPPSVDLTAYPVVPDIPPEMATSLNDLYNSGVTNFSNQAGAFSKIGDGPVDSVNFLVPFATGDYDLGSFGYLQATIDFYAVTPVRAYDPALNSFSVDSVAAGADFDISTLFTSAPAEPPCDTLGGTHLSCELEATRPSIALISFSPGSIAYMDSATFRAELQNLVDQTLSRGVIPVLATIPANSSVSLPEPLINYNEAIVEVATNSNFGIGVPLWNLWLAMQNQGITNPNSVAPEGPGNLTASALNYGYNVRNYTALEVLAAVRQGAGIE